MRRGDGGERDDAQLVRDLARGERDALAVLYDRHGTALFTFLRRWTNDEADAEDLMHQSFLRLLEPKARFNGRGSFRTWLFTVARNLATDRHRREQRMASLETGPPALDGTPDALTGLISEENRQRLGRALQTVTEDQREVLLLRTLLKVSHEQLGQVLGCTAGAARARLYRATAALRSAWYAQEEAR